MSFNRLPNYGLPRLVWSTLAAILLAAGAAAAWHRPSVPVKPPTAIVPRLSPSAHRHGKVHYDLLAQLLADDRRASGDKWLSELAEPEARFRLTSQSHPLLDQPAVDFTLVDHRGRPWNLQAQLARGPVVLVFYLGYYCSACVHGLVVLDADLKRFHHLGAEVVAVSGDSPELTRARFEEYGALSFPVLSDPDHEIARAYGVLRSSDKTTSDDPLHGTFVISPDGLLRWAYRGDTPLANNKTLLYEVAQLQDKHESPELQPKGNSIAP